MTSEMAIRIWIFLVVFIGTMIIGLALDYAKSKEKGWTPAYTAIWNPMVSAWHLFWRPLTFLYEKWKNR